MEIANGNCKFQILKHLGDGGFGSVNLIEHSIFGRVAYKKITSRSSPAICDCNLDQLRQEASIQQRLRHPNIVMLYEAHFDPPIYGLFLEYMEHESVDSFVEQYEVTWQWKLQIVYDVSLAMTYLHEQKPVIIHGDLKCENILIGDSYHAKISDFGLARVIQELTSSEEDRQVSGTPEYIAPEYLVDPSKKKVEKFDVYGFGISVWEIFSEKRAYYDLSDRKLISIHIPKGTRPLVEDIKDEIPQTLREMMKNCWQENEELRPSFDILKTILHSQVSLIESDNMKVFSNKGNGPNTRNVQTTGVQTQEHSEMPSMCEHISQTVMEKHIDGFKKVRHELVKYLDSENGLLGCLNSRDIITDDQYNQLDIVTSTSQNPKSYIDLNKELVFNYIYPRISSHCEAFLEALIENDQQHIVNFIKDGGINYELEDRVLDKKEIAMIDNNLFCLISFINPYRCNFLHRLLSRNCISNTHIESVEKLSETQEKVNELLKIMKRRSLRNVRDFKVCLHDTMQNKIVDILEKGGVVRVRVELRDREDRETIERKLVDLVTGFVDETDEIDKSLTSEQVNIIKGLLKTLKTFDVHLIGNTAWTSIAFYFQYKTVSSLERFKQIHENGDLKILFERMFCGLLGISDDASTLIKDVSIDKYSDLHSENNNTFLESTLQTAEPVEPQKENCNIEYFQFLPREMMELILLKSILQIISVDWKTNIQDNKFISGSFNLYETVSRKMWMSVYASLKSVSYHWMQGRYLKRRLVLKQFFLRRLHEHYTIFSEQLNCRYVFVECLETEGIITDEERRDIMEADGDVDTGTYEDIPESCWPQMRDSEQMLMSNRKLLKCLPGKNYSQISKFLKLMEDIGLTHVLNYFIDNEEPRSTDDIWPLTNKQRRNIIKCGAALVEHMNILVRLEGRAHKQKSEEEYESRSEEHNLGEQSISVSQDHPTQPNLGVEKAELNLEEREKEKKSLEEFRTTDRRRDVGTGGSKRQSMVTEEQNGAITVHHKSEAGSNCDRQNLIDLLYSEGCISLLQKLHIEQHSTRHLQNLEMLQLIKNGNIKTFKVALEYFRKTNQDHVYDLLNRKYLSEDIQLAKCFEIEIKNYVVGIADLEGKIYMAFFALNTVWVFPEQRTSDIVNYDIIELRGMAHPRDMVASKHSRSILISDGDNRCLWKIQIPGRRISRWEVDGKPNGMSIAQSDQSEMLILHVDRKNRGHLNIYNPLDMTIVSSVPLPTELSRVFHAVQTPNGNFLITFSKKDALDTFLISELSVDGKSFTRDLDPRLVGLYQLNQWYPVHSSIDEVGNIFIADCDHDRIVLLNSRLTDFQILLNMSQHSVESPMRICYLEEKQQLIVGHRLMRGGSTQYIRVFNLCPQTLYTDHQTPANELSLIKSGSVEMNTERCDTRNQFHHQALPDIELVGQFGVKREKAEIPVRGVAWLERKIYVVCRDSNKVHAFLDDKPFDELEENEIEIREMKDPWDIAASNASRSIFISDFDNKCFWRVRIPGNEIEEKMVEGLQKNLSITSLDELMVVVLFGDRYTLEFYNCSDIRKTQSVLLSAEIRFVLRLLESSNGNLIISYSTNISSDEYMISELSIDGKNFIRSFHPRSVESGILVNWFPVYLTLDEFGNIFVADRRHQKLYLLNSQLSHLRNPLKANQHRLRGPQRLCYVQDRHQLIVGQAGRVGEPGRISVFNVIHPVTVENQLDIQ